MAEEGDHSQSPEFDDSEGAVPRPRRQIPSSYDEPEELWSPKSVYKFLKSFKKHANKRDKTRSISRDMKGVISHLEIRKFLRNYKAILRRDAPPDYETLWAVVSATQEAQPRKTGGESGGSPKEDPASAPQEELAADLSPDAGSTVMTTRSGAGRRRKLFEAGRARGAVDEPAEDPRSDPEKAASGLLGKRKSAEESGSPPSSASEGESSSASTVPGPPSSSSAPEMAPPATKRARAEGPAASGPGPGRGGGAAATRPADPDPFFSRNESEIIRDRMLRATRSPALARWSLYEFFYSHIDLPWYAENEFQALLDSYGLSHVRAATRTEWSWIRSLLGRPRRFSRKFLHSEMQALEAHREISRSIHRSPSLTTLPLTRTPIARPLRIGQPVSAIHPLTRTVQVAQVIGVFERGYVIHFEGSDEPLHVPDTDVAPDGALVEMVNKEARRQLSAALDVPPESLPLPVSTAPQPITPVELESAYIDSQLLATLYRLMVRKRHLLNDLADLHSAVAADSSYSGVGPFTELYAWIIVQLETTNQALQPTLFALRRRLEAGAPSPAGALQSPSRGGAGGGIATPRPVGAGLGTPTVAEATGSDAGAPPTTPSSAVSESIGGRLASISHALYTSRIERLKAEGQSPTASLGVRELVTSILSLMLQIQMFAEYSAPRAEIESALAAAAAALAPMHQENEEIFTGIQAELTKLQSLLQAHPPT